MYTYKKEMYITDKLLKL